jgi:hypothetical protein
MLSEIDANVLTLRILQTKLGTQYEHEELERSKTRKCRTTLNQPSALPVGRFYTETRVIIFGDLAAIHARRCEPTRGAAAYNLKLLVLDSAGCLAFVHIFLTSLQQANLLRKSWICAVIRTTDLTLRG